MKKTSLVTFFLISSIALAGCGDKIYTVTKFTKNEELRMEGSNMKKTGYIVSATLKTDKVKREKDDKKTKRWYTVIFQNPKNHSIVHMAI